MCDPQSEVLSVLDKLFVHLSYPGYKVSDFL